MFAKGVYMDENLIKKIMDITDIELTPGNPDICFGNGDQGYECCCDECDHFLLCFPEFDIQVQEENLDASKDDTDK